MVTGAGKYKYPHFSITQLLFVFFSSPTNICFREVQTPQNGTFTNPWVITIIPQKNATFIQQTPIIQLPSSSSGTGKLLVRTRLLAPAPSISASNKSQKLSCHGAMASLVYLARYHLHLRQPWFLAEVLGGLKKTNPTILAR